MDDLSSTEQIESIKKWLGSGSLNIFGSPFSGKDTQGKQLAQFFDAPLIGGGQIIRSSTNERVKKIINEGKLAPTEDYLAMMLPYFGQAQFNNKPLILSSVGRWHGEEEAILQATTTSGHPIKAAINLVLSRDQVYQRWETNHGGQDRGSRADDATGILDIRMQEFQTKTLPVLDFYRQRGLLVEIDGSKAPAEVTSQVLTELARRATNPSP